MCGGEVTVINCPEAKYHIDSFSFQLEDQVNEIPGLQKQLGRQHWTITSLQPKPSPRFQTTQALGTSRKQASYLMWSLRCRASQWGSQLSRFKLEEVHMFPGRGVWIKNARQIEKRYERRRQRHRTAEPGEQSSKYWIHPRLFSICSYTPIQKEGGMVPPLWGPSQYPKYQVTTL